MKCFTVFVDVFSIFRLKPSAGFQDATPKPITRVTTKKKSISNTGIVYDPMYMSRFVIGILERIFRDRTLGIRRGNVEKQTRVGDKSVERFTREPSKKMDRSANCFVNGS